MKKFLILAVPVFLAGCGLPPAVSIASWAIDGILLAASGKTSTDHAISIVTQQDCAMWRIVSGEEICAEIAPGEIDGIAIAQNEVSDDTSSDALSQEDMADVGAKLSQIATAAGRSEETENSTYRVSHIPFGTEQTYAGDELAALTRKSHVPLPTARPFGRPAPTYYRSPAEDPALGAVPSKPSEDQVNTSALPAPAIQIRQIAALEVLDDSSGSDAAPVDQVATLKGVSIAAGIGDRSKYLVLGSFSKRDNAERRAASLARFDAFVVTARVKGKVYHRVLSGAPEDVEISVYQHHVERATGANSWVVTLCSDGTQAISCSVKSPMVSASLRSPATLR